MKKENLVEIFVGIFDDVSNDIAGGFENYTDSFYTVCERDEVKTISDLCQLIDKMVLEADSLIKWGVSHEVMGVYPSVRELVADMDIDDVADIAIDALSGNWAYVVSECKIIKYREEWHNADDYVRAMRKLRAIRNCLSVLCGE